MKDESYLQDWKLFLTEVSQHAQNRLSHKGHVTKGSAPFTEKPPTARSKSAPAGFGGSNVAPAAESLAEVEVEEDVLFKPLSKQQKSHGSKFVRIKYKNKPLDKDGIIDPETAKDEKEEALYEKKDRCYRIAKRKYKAFPSAYACVPESSSKALTREGWKTVEEISIGEEILTFNIYKDELEFKPILNVHRYKDTPTQIVRSGNNGFIFESTSNHKWVVKLPETVSERKNKYNRINDMALIETSDLLENKNNKLLVVSAPYKSENNIIKNKIYKYGDNWIKYLLEASSAQRQAWLFSAIVYDGNQQKVERLTENKQGKEELEWKYDGKNDKQTFGFKQKDIIHRDAFLLSAFLNEGLVTWKKADNKEIYSCHYSSNKRYKNATNLKIVAENTTDVWCPETENNTWVMMQETNGQGIITITGNSGAIVKCRQGKIWKKEK